MKEDGLEEMAEEATADLRRAKAAGSASRCTAKVELTKLRESSGSGEERRRQWWSGEAVLEPGCGAGSAELLRKTNDGHARARGRCMGPDRWRQRRRWLGLAVASVQAVLWGSL